MNTVAQALSVTLEVSAMPEAGAGPIPRTGFETGGLAAAAALLVFLGVLAVLLARTLSERSHV